jgi:hypothetical protein
MTDTATTATVTSDYEASRRAGVIEGLRALADFLDQHPDLTTPNVLARVYPHADTDAAERAVVDQIAAVLGVSSEGTTHYAATRMFGAVEFEACAIARSAKARYRAANSYYGVVEPESEPGR